MENTVRYKQFDLIVKVKLDGSSGNLYEIVVTARQMDSTQRDCTWLAYKEFASEEEACDFGLQEARKWLDAQDLQP